MYRDRFYLAGIVSRATARLNLTADEAYRNGYTSGRDGANDTNCHFANFATPALTAAWQRGERDAKTGREPTP